LGERTGRFGESVRVAESKYQNKVRRRIERLEEQIRIKARREVAARLIPPPGSPPFAYRPAFEIAGKRPVSAAEDTEARLHSLRRAARHRADVRHPRPQREARGIYSPMLSSEQYACGVFALETADARTKAFTRAIWLTPDAANAYGAWRQGAPPFTHEEWERGGERCFGVETMPDTPSTADREMMARILAKSPGRKRGRPPKANGKIELLLADPPRDQQHAERRERQPRARVASATMDAGNNRAPKFTTG
jgi:hypothetical protein